MKFLRGRFDQRAAQQHLRQEGAQPDGRVDDGGNQRGRTRIDFGHHDDTQVLRLAGNVGAAIHQHCGIDAFHLQIIGAGNALVNPHVTAYKVKRKALSEHVAEIKCQTARQGLQAQHAEQFGQARIGLQKLTRIYVDSERASQRRVVHAQG